MCKLLENVSVKKGPIWVTRPKEWIKLPLDGIHKTECINILMNFRIFTLVWNLWAMDESVICFSMSVHPSFG